MSESTEQTNWFRRPAKPEDETFLDSLFCQLHAADFAGVSLPPEQVQGLLRMQARAQRLGYLRDFPAAQSSLVVIDGAAIGRLLVDYQAGSTRLVDIALLPEWQGRGIGTKLLRGLQAEAQERALPLQLSVQPANRALQLYTSLGFRIVSGGMQLGMEWSPKGEQEAPEPVVPTADAESIASPATGSDDPVALLPTLTGKQFRVEDAPLELTLDRVQHHRAVANLSFSLFFRGSMEMILPQGLRTLSLVSTMDEHGRQFLIFLVPVGPAEGNMEYEAVFNL